MLSRTEVDQLETAGRVDVHFCENVALVEDEPTFSPARTPSPPHPGSLPASSMVVGLQGGTLESVKMVRFGVCSGHTVGAADHLVSLLRTFISL